MTDATLPEMAAATGFAFSVVFGKADGITVGLNDIGDRGFEIVGNNVQDKSGHSVSGVGDVNGDGLADIIISALDADPDGNSDAGQSYIVMITHQHR